MYEFMFATFTIESINTFFKYNSQQFKRMLVHMCTSTWIKNIGCHAGCQMVSRRHNRSESEEYIGIYCVQARKHTSKGSALTVGPGAGITRSPKQGYQWPHKKD